MAENDAPHSPASAAGAACTCRPGRPALTQIEPSACAETSNTVGYAFFMPSGLHPPRMYPVAFWMPGYRQNAPPFFPTAAAAFFMSSWAATGTTNT